MYGVIYKLTNKINGHFYVGQTKTRFASRWAKHCQDARNGAGWVLAAAIRKHGVENFTHEILCECNSKEALNAAEYSHIKQLTPVYNSNGGGDALGSPSAEVRAKISATSRGRRLSDETRKRMSIAQKGHPTTEGTKHKIRNALAGRHVRKAPIRAEEKQALVTRNKARRVHPERTDLHTLYAEAGAVTRNEKIKLAQLRHHALHPASLVGAKNPMFGKKLSPQRVAAMAVENTGNRNPFFGKQHSDETRAKMREAHLARPPVKCPHCDKVGHLNTMKRWHFDNCRSLLWQHPGLQVSI